MMWAMGGHAYKLNDDKLTINITKDKGAQRFMDLWQKMRDEDLIDVHTKTWTDDWMKSLGDGSIASLISGAWMANNLLQGVPQATGKFRVALLPTIDGTPINGEYGGSGLAITKKIPDGKLDAAKKFVEYVTTNDEGIDARVSNGSFPATTKTLNQKDFLTRTTLKNTDGSDNEFFGGQKYNEIFSQAAKDVTGKWEFLPLRTLRPLHLRRQHGIVLRGQNLLQNSCRQLAEGSKGLCQGSRLHRSVTNTPNGE